MFIVTADGAQQIGAADIAKAREAQLQERHITSEHFCYGTLEGVHGSRRVKIVQNHLTQVRSVYVVDQSKG